MSVIGPRPHMLQHTEQYSELINYTSLCQTEFWLGSGKTVFAEKELIEMKDRVD
jgi:lipopolysaccharide/colanic/teichoic acid biosynthesis glycosyltransferase